LGLVDRHVRDEPSLSSGAIVDVLADLEFVYGAPHVGGYSDNWWGFTMKSITLGLAAASALLLATSTVLAAGETEMSQEYSSCIDKANGVNPALIDCAIAETKRQDARLNENYKRLMSKLTQERKNALLEAQRAWIMFRDANCAFWDDPAGGQSAAV